MEKKLVIGVVVLTFLALNIQVQALTVTRGASWDNICNGGVCTHTLYSYQVNTIYDGIYQPVEDVYSLAYNNNRFIISKDGQPDVYINVNVKVGPFERGMSEFLQNYPLIQITPIIEQFRGGYEYGLNISNIPPGLVNLLKYIDLEFDSEVEAFNDTLMLNNLTLQFNDLKGYGFNFSIIGNKVRIGNVTGKKELYLDPTIILNYTNSGILADTHSQDQPLFESAPGAAWILIGGDDDCNDCRYQGWFKFNVSEINDPRANIENATLYLYHKDDTANHTDETFNYYGVANYTWTDGPENNCTTHESGENGVNVPNCPQESELTAIATSIVPGDVSDSSYWQTFNVTSWVASEIAAKNTNITIMVNRTYNETGNDYCYFYSKEYISDVTLRPYLNISYNDNTGPIITVEKPINATYGSNTVELNVSANQEVDTWNYSINSTANVSFTPNTTVILDDGNYNIIFYANDTGGIDNQSIRYWFTIDATIPTLTSLYINPTCTEITDNATATWDQNDVTSDILKSYCNWTSPAGRNYTINATNQTIKGTATCSFVLNETGVWSLVISVTDTANHTNTDNTVKEAKTGGGCEGVGGGGGGGGDGGGGGIGFLTLPTSELTNLTSSIINISDLPATAIQDFFLTPRIQNVPEPFTFLVSILGLALIGSIVIFTIRGSKL